MTYCKYNPISIAIMQKQIHKRHIIFKIYPAVRYITKNEFQRSRSEILMSQTPPNTFYNHATFTDHDYRSSTLPKDLKRETNGSSSPTLSVKSLNLKPSSPRLGKVKFGSSPSNMCKMDNTSALLPANGKLQYLVAVHR